MTDVRATGRGFPCGVEGDQERDVRQGGRGRDPRRRRRCASRDPHSGCGRALCLDDEHRQRLSDHRPDAEAVQDGRAPHECEPDMIAAISQIAYLTAGALFIIALNWMNAPATARKGVYAGVAGTATAVLVTWAEPSVIHHRWMILATIAAFAVGIPLSRVPLTAVPQRTAL